MIKKVIDDVVEIYVPECTCNEKRDWIKWKHSTLVPNENAKKYAEAHEELHKLTHEILTFMSETGKMDRESIIEEFNGEYNIPQITIAATLILAPIKFPRRRRAPISIYKEIRDQAEEITYRYLKMKEFDEEKDCDCYHYQDDIFEGDDKFVDNVERCEYHQYIV